MEEQAEKPEIEEGNRQLPNLLLPDPVVRVQSKDVYVINSMLLEYAEGDGDAEEDEVEDEGVSEGGEYGVEGIGTVVKTTRDKEEDGD